MTADGRLSRATFLLILAVLVEVLMVMILVMVVMVAGKIVVVVVMVMINRLKHRTLPSETFRYLILVLMN